MKLKKFFLSFFAIFFILIPVISLADDYIENDSISLEIESSSTLAETPNINARHSIVLDRNSNTILFGKSENEKCKMASTTKIMTCIVVLENCRNLNDVVTVSKKAARNWRFKAGLIHR